jgi:lipoprotein-releasing system permease protein
LRYWADTFIFVRTAANRFKSTGLNLSYFIARRITSNRRASFSSFIIRLSTLATALSVAVMIVAVAVVFGFKETIKDKMFVFWGHILVAPFNPNPSSIITPEPFDFDARLAQQIKSVDGVQAVYPFALKPAILSTSEALQGVKLKGVDQGYDWNTNDAIRFGGMPPDFSAPHYAQQLVVSESVLRKLESRVGDSLLIIFIDPEQSNPRMRKLQISGSFHTGMEEVDKHFAFCDIRLLRRVSNWDDGAINGYQIHVNNFLRADSIGNRIYRQYLEPPMTRNSIQELYPNIFNWLGLMNTNAYIILAIMAVVAVINLSTALLIFIMERTTMIGILKALGMSAGKMQRIFLYHAGSIALKGILLGTVMGVGLCLLQQYTHFISMDESAYYMQYAPIKLVPLHVLLIGSGTLLFCLFVMIIPSLMVRTINIVRALRFK